VNIDGGKTVEIHRGSDKWLYDLRIDKEFQSGPNLYSNNDLDRGHLVRRLDPVWGDPEIAEKANDDTFYFTNCAPQHMNLNRRNWVGLEDYILENADNYDFKASIFTGPVLRADDMVYRGEYQIPVEFWKVAVMVKEGKELSVTAYLLTQKNLITDLEFAYGEYETYQVPLDTIQKLTGIDFGKLKEYDPMEKIESLGGFVIKGPNDIRL
jgi:endonuclease G